MSSAVPASPGRTSSCWRLRFPPSTAAAPAWPRTSGRCASTASRARRCRARYASPPPCMRWRACWRARAGSSSAAPWRPDAFAPLTLRTWRFAYPAHPAAATGRVGCMRMRKARRRGAWRILSVLGSICRQGIVASDLAMHDSIPTKPALAALARHLAARRNVILRNWQRSVELDPELTTSSGLSRAQFNDHIPQVLDAFERRLQARDPVEKDVAFEDQKSSAAGHGLHRWQQGYKQRETIREWGHLHYWVLHELEDYAQANPHLQSSVMPIARRALVRLCGEGVCESAASYERLQRTEAA